MRRRQFCACAALWFVAALPSHLRATNDRILEAIQFAAARSATFRALMSAIDGSDRIVHVLEGSCPNGTARSCVQPVAESRYLRVLVDPRQTLIEVIRQIAHEFQHVVEIASNRSAVGAPAIRELYERIGFRSCTGDGSCYETRAAKEVERIVSREVLSGRPASINNAYFGAWHLNLEKSSYDTCPPVSGRRFDRDQGHDLVSTVVDVVDCAGTAHRDAFVYKADGRDYQMTAKTALSGRTIAVMVIDASTSAFVIKDDRVVVACGRRTISADGSVLTIEAWHVGEAAHRTFEVWEKSD